MAVIRKRDRQRWWEPGRPADLGFWDQMGGEPVKRTLRDALSIGDRRLRMAVLENAVSDLRNRHDGIRQDAERWFRSDSRVWLFSFRAVCEALEFNPVWFREQLALRPVPAVPPRRLGSPYGTVMRPVRVKLRPKGPPKRDTKWLRLVERGRQACQVES